MRVIVAIDGPVGSGKSTIAKALGQRLDLDVLETGAMYRAVAAGALRRGVEPGPDTAEALVEVAAGLTTEDGVRLQVHGEDVTDDLRTPAVNRAVSAVAAEARVREELVRRQREWAVDHGGGVIEGRDIGTVVFPDATVKVFLTASDEERARRRNADEDAADIARRDHLDKTRSASPLVAADDALVIDSTDMTVEEIVDEIVSQVERARR
jgi:cytidylate kinase